MNTRMTVQIKSLPTDAKGVSPDEFNPEQQRKNDKFNKKATQIGNAIIEQLKDVDITWLTSGHAVISTSSNETQIEKCLNQCNLDIVADRIDIKHKVKEKTKDVFEEDIDFSIEKKENNPRKPKAVAVLNKFKQ